MRPLLALLLPLPIATACGGSELEPPAEERSCGPGYLDDGGSCVPEACGIGTWGNLEVDDATVYVDIGAVEGGVGTADAPLRSIQAGLDLAGSRDGGLVAVAAGAYAETLELTTEHAGVQLAGRCRELVTLDASLDAVGVPGVLVDTLHGEVSVRGLSVEGSSYLGVLVDSGKARLEESVVSGSAVAGVAARRASLVAASELSMVDCEIAGNTDVGVYAEAAGTVVDLRRVAILDTVPDFFGEGGQALLVRDGASVHAEACDIAGNHGSSVQFRGAGAEGTFLDVTIEDTQLNGVEMGGYGVEVYDGAHFEAESCRIHRSANVGVLVTDPGTEVRLVDVVVSDTRPDEWGLFGDGIVVDLGATLSAEGCSIERNSESGVSVMTEGSSVRLVDVVIRDTLPTGLGEYGHGVHADAGTRLMAADCLLEGNHGAGISATGSEAYVELEGVTIRDTQPEASGEYGLAVEVYSGAELRASNCEFVSATTLGLAVVDEGSRADLRDCVIAGTRRNRLDAGGYGVQVDSGGRLTLERSLLASNVEVGVMVEGPGSVVELRGVRIEDTQRPSSGLYGCGLLVHEGAEARAEDLTVVGSSGAGVLVLDEGSTLHLDGSVIERTTGSASRHGMVAPGLTVQGGARLEARGLEVSGTEGPGLLAWYRGIVQCTDCDLIANEFAGAAVLSYGRMRLGRTTVSSTVPSANLGGGVGVYAAEQGSWGPPELAVVDSWFSDNEVAGVWLMGEGQYALSDSAFTGGTGVGHGTGLRCGDGVFASGVSAWDGNSGLRLMGNDLADNAGAGLLLHGSAARVEGNSWSGNQPDLLVQGDGCMEQVEDYGDVPGVEVCPVWDRPTCSLAFSLTMGVDEVQPYVPPPSVRARR